MAVNYSVCAMNLAIKFIKRLLFRRKRCAIDWVRVLACSVRRPRRRNDGGTHPHEVTYETKLQ
ncbi:hypothetical protein, partial [Burkholderia pseudomallei]|uniref:hypothetical protein n=1 Tax=Burkholderia pseudomallei TaxID=28450 RepID=UPI0020D137D9